MEYIASIITGLAIIIPVVAKLIEYITKYIREKNWGGLMTILMKYIEEAETMFDDGATRKEWVLAMIEQSAEIINYDVDMNIVGDLIDKLCNMSKKVNVKVDTPSDIQGSV